MIKKIISGGEIGVEQAALEVAARFAIAHGGWIPRWRDAEDETLAEKYHLEEMPHANYSQTTAQNVLDSDGTLIISRGDLTGNCALNRRFAQKNKRPLLHIDLNKQAEFQAARKIESWVRENRIAVLNVTGTKADNDSKIYQTASDILETALEALFINVARYDPSSASDDPVIRLETLMELPRTIEQAVDILLSRLSFREKTKLANIPQEKLMDTTSSLRRYVKNEFRLWGDNEKLIRSARSLAGKYASDEASFLIVMSLWEKLQKTGNVLRIVKD